MTYQECLDWLFSQLPIYQRTGSIAYKADIGNIVQATEKLGNPHQNFKSPKREHGVNASLQNPPPHPPIVLYSFGPTKFVS